MRASPSQVSEPIPPGDGGGGRGVREQPRMPEHLLTGRTPVTRILITLSVVALAACGSILHGTGSDADDTSREHKPPPSWEAGIQFHFADSAWTGQPAIGDRLYGAEVRFHDGRRERVVTGSDLFYSSASVIQTPWYRIWLPAGAPDVEPTLRVTIGDRHGNRAVAEYPVRVVRREFFRVLFAVYTPRADEGPWISPARSTGRAYDVPVGAKQRQLIPFASGTTPFRAPASTAHNRMRPYPIGARFGFR